MYLYTYIRVNRPIYTDIILCIFGICIWLNVNKQQGTDDKMVYDFKLQPNI